MNKILALAFPLLILAGAAITLVTLEARRTPDWQNELNSTIARSRAPGETVTIRAAVQAGRPENFRAGMGRPAGSDRGYSMWATGAAPSGPPAALHCVLLERARKSAAGAAEEPLRQVVYVGYYDDGLWQVGWLAYEASTADLQANLDAVGCDLRLK